MAQNTFNPINILDTTDATGIGSGGSLTIGGGASIGKDFYVGGNMSVSGTTTSFSDNILLINKNPTSSCDTGLLFQRFTNDISNDQNYSGILYSETSDEFHFGYMSSDISRSNATIDSFVRIKTNGIISISNLNTIGNIFTNSGSVGIATTNPSATLDVNGTFNTITGTIATLVSSNANITNITVGTLALSNANLTTATIGNIIATTSSAGTAVATTYTGGSISLTGGVNAVTGTIGNFVATNISSGGFYGTNSTITNFVATSNTVTTAVATTYTGGSISLTGAVNAVTGTIGNFVATNISSGGFYGTNSTITNVVATNTSSGGFYGTNSTITNVVATNISSGTLKITSTLMAMGDSNTVGSIFTIGGNTGIGTVNPSSKLEVYDAASSIIRASGAVSGQQGFNITDSASRWSIYKPGNTTDLRFFDGTDDRITFKNGGNVGIGTKSPENTLHVYGTGGSMLHLQATSGDNSCIMKMTPSNGNFYTLFVRGTGESGAAGNGFFISSGGFAPNFVINNYGYIGIGTAYPQQKFEVYGGRIRIDDTNNAVLELKTNSKISYIFTNASGNLEMYPALSSEHIYLQPGGGKLAVGTASSNTPACPLHVKGDGSGGTIRTYPSTYNSESSIGFYSGESSGSYWVAGKGSWSAGEGLGIGNSAYGSAVMTLGTNGGVGIRTSPSYPLHVNGSMTGALVYSYFAYAFNSYSAGYGGASVPISIYASDRVAASEFNAYSDSRIKTNVQDVVDSSALETIRQIEPKRYKYIDTLKRTNETVWGFIAQQVGSVLENSTGKITDFVPNIFDKVSVSELDGDTLLTLQNRISVEFDISDNATRRIRLHTQDDTEVFVTLKTVVSSNSFTVEETLSESSYFAYGQEVKDFHTLNKDAIFTVAVAALQEVDRQLQETRTELQETRTELQETRTELQETRTELQQTVNNLLQRIEILENPGAA